MLHILEISVVDTDHALYKYAYYYEYDALKRMTFKKLPGCEPVYMVYDKRDRLVLTQDGNMRAANTNKWSYTEYNTKNRPVESGEIVLSASFTHAQLIDSMMKSENIPSGTRTPLQYIRYDKYTANEQVTPHAFTSVLGYAEDYHSLTTGLVTATKTRVLGTNQWITSTVYYDSKCRPMQEITDNLVGGVTRVTHSYDFVGNVVKSQETYGTNTLEYAYTYDNRNRLLNVTSSLNGVTPIVMKTLEYDEVGRLKKVKLHNNTTSSEYAYNIRSWLTGINGSKFTQSLSYGNGNGNIQSMNWNANGSSHSYNFTYDGANRLLDAIHGTGAYTEKVMSYDKNGNIMGLQRYGNGLIDDLAYTYNGNQLTQVEDATGNSAGFNNGVSTTNEYTYDYNGNLTKDSNKGIANISWNSLNLPNVVSFSDGSTITYTYAADGTKIRTVHNINGTTTQTDYCGSAIYENGTAKLWQTEAGYISMTDSRYHYYLQDHQGNNRVVVSETGATEEVNHYYAFGGLFGNSNNVQPFKYNGKELDTQKGLNWYDYGARQYDATLGRWFAVDPLAEKYYDTSTYSYCSNSPLKYADPTGAMKVIYNPDGTYKETTHNNWFHNTFMGRQEYIDHGDKMTRLSEEEFWQWQITGNWGSIKPADNLTTFEFWLDSTSDNIMDGIIKFLVSEIYSVPNSIKSILTGKTIGGTLLTPIEKQEKFIDLVESLPVSKFIKIAHPGTNKEFFKKNPIGYFTKKKYKEKVNHYKEFSKNKKSYNMIMDYYVNLLNEIEEENNESNY